MEEPKPDLSDKFDAIAKDVRIPGIDFCWGFMGEEFYFQARIYFRCGLGNETSGLGGYYFPNASDFESPRRMHNLLREAAAAAFRTMVAQTMAVNGHKPFASNIYSY